MMDELNLKNLLPKVKAPEDFEEKVLEQIQLRKKSKIRYLFVSIRILRRRTIFVATALLALFISGIFFIPQFFKRYEEPKAVIFSVSDQFQQAEPSILSLIEPVDFNRDLGDIPAKRVVYILEAVNENFIPEVKY